MCECESIIGRLILKEDAGIENVRNSRCVVHSGMMVCNGCYGTVLLVTHLNSWASELTTPQETIYSYLPTYLPTLCVQKPSFFKLITHQSQTTFIPGVPLASKATTRYIVYIYISKIKAYLCDIWLVKKWNVNVIIVYCIIY